MASTTGLNIPTRNLRVCIDGFNNKSINSNSSTWYDLSGNGLNFSGGTSSASGNTSQGRYMASADNDAQTATTDALDTDYHTIAVVLRFTGDATYPNGTTGGWQQFIGYFGGGTDRSPGIWRYPSNRRIHWTYNPGNTSTDFGASGLSTDFNLNEDYLVIMRKDGSNTHFWINETKYNGITYCANPKTSGTSVINLFNYYSGGLMQMKYFLVYDTALPDADCYQIAASLTPRLK
mgnify:CR=1 FL=1|tara:strand:- start:312 stop:1013 length:702 start_codon:yes stop_codon:yes gene_type:complete